VGNGAEVIELLSSYEPDDHFADDVRAVREAVTSGAPTWPAD